ncbi:MAG TPA: FAD-dependent oxidoreductase [Solirubrobacteraceae bacterium]|nr:FAD-dependent oxidoreductase [Solirubrobacteraceae bacterium]
MSATDRPAIVVGGGIAGLVAARRLALEGREVVVLEAGDRLGGQLARHIVGGIELDAGAESFATRGGQVAALATALGLGDDIVGPSPSPAWLYRADGSAVPLPKSSVLGIPGTPLAADVIAAIGTRAAMRAELDAILPGFIGSRAVTLGELVERRMGRGVLDGLVAPVVRGVHSTDPSDLPIDRAHPGLRAAMRRDVTLAAAVRGLRARAPAGSQVAGIRGGVVRLVVALAAELARFGVEVRTGARVVEVDADGARLEGGERVPGDVLIAAPGVTGQAEQGRRVTLVTLVVDAPELDAAPRGTGVLVAAGAGVAARALTHVTAKWPWVAETAGGRHVLRLSYDGTLDGGVREIEARAVSDATVLLGTPIASLIDSAIVPWERAAQRMHAVDGMQYVGESESGTGIAAVVAQADAVSGSRLGGDQEPQG